MAKRTNKSNGSALTYILVCIVLLLGMICFFLASELQKEFSDISKESVSETAAYSDMEVHFIDVGQGDATLVVSDGHYMLIDAGDNSKGTAVQLYLTKLGVERLDYLILTHTDADHIGGADVIITKFDIDHIFIGDFPKESRAYEELMEALEYRNMSHSVPEVGAQYPMGDSGFTIIAPNGTYEDPNNSSIALLLENGANSFLFSGDAEQLAEDDILQNEINIDCDVYKAGHHGSRTSSTEAFVRAMTPEYIVISCAEENEYGHPHPEPMERFREIGAEVFRTDKQGSVIAYSDGKEITWNCEPCDDWSNGFGEN